MFESLLLAASIAAFAVSTVAGGGAGLMLVPVLALIVPAAEVPAALSLGTATSALGRIVAFRRAIQWDIVRWFVPAALPAVLLGAGLLAAFDPVYVKLLLGLFLVANLPLLFRRKPATVTAHPVRPRAVMLIGAAAGLISGFTGAVGLLFNHFYHRLGLTREAIVATRAANEILLHLLKLAAYAVLGLLTAQALLAGGIVALGALVAALLMRWALPLIDEALFKRVGHAAMVSAGAAMLATSTPLVLARNHAGVVLVSEARERELAVFWGRHRVAVEWVDGGLAIERRLKPNRVPAAIRALVAAQPARSWSRSIASFSSAEPVMKSWCAAAAS